MKAVPIFILTGAGISAESGIQTFRGSDGLWENHRIEDVATPEGFATDPVLVHQFYNERRRKLLLEDIQPNTAHKELARLEQNYPSKVTVVTQNIDNLHERSGSKRVIHMHGELLKGFCLFCDTKFEIRDDLSVKHSCAHCGKTGGLRPDVVWFGEQPYHMDTIYTELSECGLFISIGTSGNVYPAAGFVCIAHENRARTVQINLEPSGGNNMFDEHHYGKAGEILPSFVNKILDL